MNSLKRNYELALEALEELAQELAPKDDDDFYDLLEEEPIEEEDDDDDDDAADQTPPRPATKPLDEVLEALRSLGAESQFHDVTTKHG